MLALLLELNLGMRKLSAGFRQGPRQVMSGHVIMDKINSSMGMLGVRFT